MCTFLPKRQTQVFASNFQEGQIIRSSKKTFTDPTPTERDRFVVADKGGITQTTHTLLKTQHAHVPVRLRLLVCR